MTINHTVQSRYNFVNLLEKDNDQGKNTFLVQKKRVDMVVPRSWKYSFKMQLTIFLYIEFPLSFHQILREDLGHQNTRYLCFR